MGEEVKYKTSIFWFRLLKFETGDLGDNSILLRRVNSWTSERKEELIRS